MGFFDTILLRVACPHCGTVNESLQTKALEPCLLTYRVGDSLPLEEFWIEEGWILGTGICENCQSGYHVRVFIRNGRILDKWEHVKETSA